MENIYEDEFMDEMRDIIGEYYPKIETNISDILACRIVENAIRRTNWEGSSDCREFYFSNEEVVKYLEDTFDEEELLDIYQRLEDGEFILIKELCNEYLNSSFNTCGNWFELYITIGKYAEEVTYCLYSQYDAEYDKEYCI